MGQRRIGQLGLLDAAVSRRKPRRADVLDDIGRLLDWAAFERLLAVIPVAAKGEPSFPALMMFKALLLQRWYGLSDPAMEAALFDRLSFQRFAGLSLDDETPDHSTIWRFRERLTKMGLIEELFAELQRQLDTHGLLIKQGTLIDASMVTSAARRPRKEDGTTSPVDPDARFGADNERRRFTFGYKMHVAVDQGTGLIRSGRLTSANIQDVSVAPDLLPPSAGTVYADRGYHSRSLRELLAQKGFGDGVMRRAHKNQPLTPEEVARNHALVPLRSPVEAVFGTLKRSYGFTRMRYFNAARNLTAFLLACMAYNLRRSLQLNPA
ncbi:transposase, IS4 family protein [Rhodopseudomonas palustris]|jgi:IS5 family transposase|uniref:IS5 family transposase n=1 Tax=Rhodopseudomonas palustris TaxID=1076 RepID=UPI000D1A287E|nr:IS5 family transposase [Rhodopseudomonas palustris]AVT78435.1 transposase, IS4 family protein [Rhodopseudomonas palustris]